MKQLASVFCMDICAYAVMSNHYHVVLRVDTEEAIALSDEAALRRWQMLFSGNLLVSRYLSDKQEDMDAAEKDKVREIAQEWRGRLTPCVSIVVASNFQLEVDKNENKIHASL
jgi:hypothetical protein